MFKSASWIGLSLAALCALPAMAEGPEHKEPMRPVFSDIDTNKDGVISQAEFEAFKPKGPEGRDGPPPPPEGRGDGPRGHGGHGPHRMGPPDLKTLDSNGDGKVSYNEFSARSKALFDKLDSDHDGALSEAELKAPPPRGPEGEDGPPPPPPEK